VVQPDPSTTREERAFYVNLTEEHGRGTFNEFKSTRNFIESTGALRGRVAVKGALITSPVALDAERFAFAFPNDGQIIKEAELLFKTRIP